MTLTTPQRALIWWQAAAGLTGVIPALFGIYRSVTALTEATTPGLKFYYLCWILATAAAVALVPAYFGLGLRNVTPIRLLKITHWGTLLVNLVLMVLYFSSGYAVGDPLVVQIAGLFPMVILSLWLALFAGSPLLAPGAKEQPELPPPTVDLARFTAGETALGHPPMPYESFMPALRREETLKPIGQGWELGLEDGLLDYVHLTLVEYAGAFHMNGQPLALTTATTENEILACFGEPYWRDRDGDGEVILFYIYQRGGVELQFEFPDGNGLGFITLACNGVLADEAQRKAYGVDKPWPPEREESVAYR